MTDLATDLLGKNVSVYDRNGGWQLTGTVRMVHVGEHGRVSVLLALLASGSAFYPEGVGDLVAISLLDGSWSTSRHPAHVTVPGMSQAASHADAAADLLIAAHQLIRKMLTRGQIGQCRVPGSTPALCTANDCVACAAAAWERAMVAFAKQQVP